MWNGVFSPSFAKGNEYRDHTADPTYELLAESPGKEYAYIGVKFNHECPPPPEWTGENPPPSNEVTYIYEVELTPGQDSSQLMDILTSPVTSKKDKMNYLDENSMDIPTTLAELENLYSKVNDYRFKEGKHRIEFPLSRTVTDSANSLDF